MKTLTRLSLIALFLVLAFAAATRTASAQLGCASITFGNNTHCNVNICLRTNIGAVCSGVLAPSGSSVIPIPAATTISGVISAGGFSYPFTPSPVPGTLWVQNVTIAPDNCCCDIIYSPATCTVKAVPSTGFPPCQP